jgi:hypothetical protein
MTAHVGAGLKPALLKKQTNCPRPEGSAFRVLSYE